MKRVVSFLLFVVIALLPMGAWAESMNQIDLSSLTLEELLVLDEAVEKRIEELTVTRATQAPVQAFEQVDDWIQYYREQGVTITSIEPTALRKKRADYAEKIVHTVLYAKKVSEDTLYCVTESDKSVWDAVLTFDSLNEIVSIREDDIIAVIGEVEKSSFLDFGDLYMNHCHIVSTGTTALDSLREIKAEMEQQRLLGEEQNKENYISSCTKVESSTYKNIEREPDTYAGQRMIVSGTVVNVSEGWFGTTTILVKDSNKHIWSIEYERPEGAARVLEKDKITAYGECTGVDSSLTAILHGAESDMIPAIEAAYIDIK